MAKTMKAVIELGGKLDGSLLKSMSSAEKQVALLNKSVGSIRKVAGAAAKAAGLAVTAAGAGVAKVVKDSIEAGKSFDASMSQVAATMGVSVDEIGQLREFAQKMGAETAFSASQAADALNYMALAGYTADQSMQALPNVLNLAAAGGIDLAAASDMVTDAQSALGLSFSQSAVMVDQMAKASSKTNTSVAQLGEAILTVGGTAKTLAGGTTELSTALGLLADNGVKGSEGGTALRNIILSLSAPTDKAALVLSRLGVEAFDANGNLRPLQDTFADLSGALSDLTQQEQTEALNNIFNKVDLKSVNALLGTNADRWNEVADAIGDSAGAAKAMADTQLDNLEGDLTIFNSALEGVQIAISDALTPTLREFVQYGTEGLGEVTKALKTDEFKGWAAGIASDVTSVLSSAIAALGDMKAGFDEGFDVGGFADAVSNLGSAISRAFGDGSDAPAAKGFGGALATALNGAAGAIRAATVIIEPVAAVLKLLADNAGVAIPLIGGVAGAMMGMKAAMEVSAAIQAVTTALGLATGATDAMAASQAILNAVMEANPIVLVVSLLAGLAAALIAAYAANEDFRNAVDGAFAAIGEAIGPVLDGIVSLLGDLCGWLADAAGAVSDFASQAGDFFGDLAGKAGEAFGEIGEAIAGDLSAAQQAGSAAADALGAALAGDWDTAAQKTVEAYSTIQGAIADKVTAAGQVVGSVADAIGNALGFPGLGNTVRGVFDSVASAMKDPIGTARDFIRDIPGEIVGYFSGIGQRITDAIGSIHFPTPHITFEDLNVADVLKIPLPHVSWYARGGFTNGPIAIAGEAGTEAVLSFDPRYRDENIGYWIKAGQMLGTLRAFAAGGFTDGTASAASIDLASPTGALATAAGAFGATGGATIDFGGVTFAPQISVAEGDAGDIMTQLRDARDEFMDSFEEWIAERMPEYGYVL